MYFIKCVNEIDLCQRRHTGGSHALRCAICALYSCVDEKHDATKLENLRLFRDYIIVRSIRLNVFFSHFQRF